RFRTPTQAERAALLSVVAALRPDGMKSTGKLHSELYPRGEMSRDVFEEVLGSMARAGLVRLVDAVFEKNGKQIQYREVGRTKAAVESPIFVVGEFKVLFIARRDDFHIAPSVSAGTGLLAKPSPR